MNIDTIAARTETLARLARGYGLPVSITTMSSEEFRLFACSDSKEFRSYIDDSLSIMGAVNTKYCFALKLALNVDESDTTLMERRAEVVASDVCSLRTIVTYERSAMGMAARLVEPIGALRQHR